MRRKYTCVRNLSLIWIVVMLGNPPFAAEWINEVNYDDILDVHTNVAQIKTADGYYFAVYQATNKEEVWVALGIPEALNRQMSQNQLPAMRVDNLDPFDNNFLIEVENMGRKQYHISPHVYSFWFPNTDSLKDGTGFLYDLVSGITLKVRYWDDEGSAHRIEFPLHGSKDAITTALQIGPLPTRQQAARNEVLSNKSNEYMIVHCPRIFSAYVEGAIAPSEEGLKWCFDIVTACTEIVRGTPSQFDLCVKRHADIKTSCHDDRSRPSEQDACNELRLSAAFPNYEMYRVK